MRTRRRLVTLFVDNFCLTILAFYVDYHSKSQRLRSILSIRNIIVMKVMANVKMMVVLSILFPQFQLEPMMIVESCHQR